MKAKIIWITVIALLLTAVCASALPLSKTATTSIKITPLIAKVKAGEQLKLTATRYPQKDIGTPATIEWASETPELATVDEQGVVSGLAAGKVVITATDRESGVSAKRSVTVKEATVTSVTLSETEPIILNAGDAYTALTATVVPAAAAPTLRWSSSKPAVASVDAITGEIKALTAGVTTITAKAGGKRATCILRVRGKGTTITISAVGDVVLGGDPRPRSALNRVTLDTFYDLIKKYGMDYPFKNVKDVFLSDDVTLINLEGTITTSNNHVGGTHVFKVDPSYVSILKDAGVDVCDLANNHSMDFRAGGLAQTKRVLDKAGIRYTYAGWGWDSPNTNATQTIEKDGMRVRIGYASFVQPVQTGKVRETVAALRERGKCDIVIVSFHWTRTAEWAAYTYNDSNAKYRVTRALAQAAIRGGADLVLGHHRHIPSGIETYRGKYIVYDLANFIVGIKHKNNHDSFIYQHTFRVDETGFVENAGIKVIPCTTTTSTETYPTTDDFGDLGAPINNWQPDILTGDAGKAVLQSIQKMSAVEIPGA